MDLSTRLTSRRINAHSVSSCCVYSLRAPPCFMISLHFKSVNTRNTSVFPLIGKRAWLGVSYNTLREKNSSSTYLMAILNWWCILCVLLSVYMRFSSESDVSNYLLLTFIGQSIWPIFRSAHMSGTLNFASSGSAHRIRMFLSGFVNTPEHQTKTQDDDDSITGCNPNRKCQHYVDFDRWIYTF